MRDAVAKEKQRNVFAALELAPKAGERRAFVRRNEESTVFYMSVRHEDLILPYRFAVECLAAFAVPHDLEHDIRFFVV